MTTASAPTRPVTDFGVVHARGAWICSLLLLVAPVRESDFEAAFEVLRNPRAARRLSIWSVS